MPVNVNSLHARLNNLAKEKKIDFQYLLNRLASEQFLLRLSLSPYVDKFIFKGGSLLTYLIESNRRTKDLDFSIKELGHRVDDMVEVIRSVIAIPIDDGFDWKNVEGSPLNHPEMEQPGMRIVCHFNLGKMRGLVRIDMAIGDIVEKVKADLKRMKYRNQPIFGESVSLFVYPPETIFSEKLYIACHKGSQNTRMKDYYDLMRLCEHPLNPKKLKRAIESTFANRKLKLKTEITFDEFALERLQSYWEHFLKRENITDAPSRITSIIDKVNGYLKNLYDSQG